jgi:hypothetical protein
MQRTSLRRPPNAEPDGRFEFVRACPITLTSTDAWALSFRGACMSFYDSLSGDNDSYCPESGLGHVRDRSRRGAHYSSDRTASQPKAMMLPTLAALISYWSP